MDSICYIEIMEQSIQKCKVHNFYQSIHEVYFDAESMTTEQLNRNIMLKSNNLYSLFQLIVSVAKHQAYADKPLASYRRLMFLIYFICHDYELYFSKLKALVRFWWENSLKARSYIQKLYGQTKALKIDVFHQKVNRDDYLFHTLRCFNILIRRIDNKSKPNSNQVLRVRNFILKSVDILKQEMSIHQQQTQHKIPLAFQYSNFLLLLYPFRKQNAQKLFQQYWESILQVIRVLKKFYNHSTPEHRAQLANLIKSGRKIFIHDTPPHKINILTNIINYVERKQEKNQRLPAKQIWDEKRKKTIIMVSRILTQWKKVHLLNLKQGDSILDRKGENRKQNLFTTNVVHISKSRNCRSNQIIKNQTTPTFRKIYQLKRKKILSVNFYGKQVQMSLKQLQMKSKLPDLQNNFQNIRRRLYSSQINFEKNEQEDVFISKQILNKLSTIKRQVCWKPQKNRPKESKLKLIRN